MTDRDLLRSSGNGWSTSLTAVELVVMRLVVFAFAVLVILAVVRPQTLGLAALTERPLAALAAALLYVINHALRALRLAVLVHDPVMSLRTVVRLHLLSAAAALLAPFRLGDLVRARLVGVVVASPSRGLVVVWLERALDVAVVVALLLVSQAGSESGMGVWSSLVVLSAGFVIVTVALVTVVPENLHAASLYLVRRRGGGGLRLLGILERVLVVLAEAPNILRRKTLTLVLLTLLVWAAELVTLAIAIPALADSPERLATGLLTLLSELASGTAAIVPGGSDGSVADVPAESAGRYRFVVLVSLLIGGTAAGAVLFGARSRTLGRAPVQRPRVRWTS